MENDRTKPETANEREERILRFWREDKTFERSLVKDSPAGEYVFYDGPPFATGLPHYGHILASAIKDTVPRYKTMKGYHVERRWGWDCHGLPIETIVEKQLGLKTKSEIEKIGVDVFNETARSKVLEYVGEWKKTVDRIGRWVDFDGAYKTMDNSYIESVWWALKQINDKGQLYEGRRILLYCLRCETPVSKAEVAMDNSYKDLTDLSLIAEFELIDRPGVFVLAWTTTPWTLPGNVALAINPETEYVEVAGTEPGNTYIIAKERMAAVFKENYKIIRTIGKDELIGKRYKPLYDYYAKDEMLKDKERGWKIYGADFVTTTDGTGVVHIAPGYGEDDMNLGNKEGLPFVQHVSNNGIIKQEVIQFGGMHVKPKDATPKGQEHQATDIEVIKDLAHRGLLFSKEKIVHSYPHCWRCESPLIYNAVSAWFIKLQNIKSRLLELNQHMHWIPDHLRDGRFKNILEGAPDWNISRNRYWASPLPVWRCAECKKVEVLGSVEDIRKHTTSGNSYFIMRHGQAVSNVLGSISCEPTGNPLTDEGVAQAESSAKEIKNKNIDLIVSSDYVRARQTAEIVAKNIGYDLDKIIFDDRLHEVNFGAYNNESVESYHSHFKSTLDRFHIRPEGGENLNDVKQRAAEFLYELEEKHKGKNILIVSHGDPTWMMQTVALGISPEEIISDLEKDYKKIFYLKNAEVRLLDFAPLPHNAKYELDLHKPYIDNLSFNCDCGGKMKRIPEVVDCWFESAAMPFAANHFPFENKEWFDKNFPGDFVAEYIAQTRTWFYYCLVLSGLLFDNVPYRNIITTGTVLAEDGSKMSKSKGNFPDPWLLLNKYGADSLRFYLLSTPLMRSEDLRFSEIGVDEIYKKLVLRLQNVVSFYELYASQAKSLGLVEVMSDNILDKWIRARLSSLAEDVEKHLEEYELDRASRPIMDFVDDLSTWYLRRSRGRFKSENISERTDAILIMRNILLDLSKIIAPFTPFIAEDIYQRVTGENTASVHLQAWPFFGEILDDETADKEKLFAEMKTTRDIVSLALDERKRSSLPVRQPLQVLKIKDQSLKDKTEFLELIKDEVNVKAVGFDDSLETEIWLDPNITPELKEEGNLRDLIRHLQDMRKQMGLKPEQKVVLKYFGGEDVQNFISKFAGELKKVVGISKVEISEDVAEDIKVGDMTLKVRLSL